MASDRETLSQVRKKTGAQPTDVDDDVILREIERGKREVNRELREMLIRDSDADIYELGDAAVDALENYVCFRVYGIKAGRQDLPKTASEMRRSDLEDSELKEYATQFVRNLMRMTDGN